MEKNVVQAMGRAEVRRKLLAFAALTVLFVTFTIASPNFIKFDNIELIILSTCVNGVLALGVTFVIITGGIDLSVGTVMTFSSVITGVLITMLNFPILVGVLGGLLAGAACGFISGWTISRMKLRRLSRRLE